MSILHQIQDSPSNSNALVLAMRYAQKEDCLLLCGNAVNTLLGNKAMLNESKCKVILLEDDIIARGLQDYVGEFELVDYSGFVSLTLSHQKVITW